MGTQIASVTPRLFTFTVPYSDAVSPGMFMTFYRNELEYIKTRIRTFRSIHSSDLDTETSQYYEGAITCVDVFDIFCRTGTVVDIKPLMVTIDNTSGHFPHVLLTTKLKLAEYGAKIALSIYYTRHTKFVGVGMFVVRCQLLEDDWETYIPGKEFTVGDVIAECLMPNDLSWTHESFTSLFSDKCFQAGNVLKYSENFWSPSILASEFAQQLRSL